MRDFTKELSRRNVFRVGIAYIVVSWLIAQAAELALDSFDAPAWVIKTILLVLVLGFPLALFFAWAYELTPEGLKKEKEVDRNQSITSQTGRKLDFIIIERPSWLSGYPQQDESDGLLAVPLRQFDTAKFLRRRVPASAPVPIRRDSARSPRSRRSRGTRPRRRSGNRSHPR